MKKTAFLAVAASFALTSVVYADNHKKVEKGAELLDQRCSVCHPSDRPKSKKKSAKEWETTVTRMIGKGAKLSADEKKVLIDYLSKTYKP